MSKKILFRVDAGGEIGLGHYYRSISLAKRLSESNYDITFIFKDSIFWNKILEKNFPFPSYIISDSNKIFSELDVPNIDSFDILYVDGFIEYKSNTIQKIKNLGLKVIYYQNLTDSRFLADIFIIPSIHQSDEFYKGFNQSTQIFKGLKYFTFNEELFKLKEKQPIKEIKNIAITSGGSDPKNVLLSWFEILNDKRFDEFQFTLFYGNDYLHKDSIGNHKKDNISWKKFNHLEILKNDFLISAFGVSTYEFLALKMPLMTFGHIKQNAESAEFLSNYMKTFINLGLIEGINRDIFYSKITYLSNNIKSVNNDVSKNEEFIDLKGIERVSKIIDSV